VQEKERVAALNGILVLKQILFFFSFLAFLFMSSSHREGCQVHCHIICYFQIILQHAQGLGYFC
jgi:hypothetical protein